MTVLNDIQAIVDRYAEVTKLIAKTTPPDENKEDPSFTALSSLHLRQAQALSTCNSTYLCREGWGESPDMIILKTRLDDVASITMSKFYAYRYDQLPSCWRYMYTEALVMLSNLDLLSSVYTAEELTEEALDSMVENLDRALITTGGLSQTVGPRWIEETLEMLDSLWRGRILSDGDIEQRAPKRRKRVESSEERFSDSQPYGCPALHPLRECPRHEGWTIDIFEEYVNNGECKPVVFTDLINHWPALTTNPWSQPSYLLSKTIGGKRLVPVEIGRSYVDEGWGQEVIRFRDFLARFISSPLSTSSESESESEQEPRNAGVGYLAQHNLFSQIPSLRSDITTPDLCWATVPPHPLDPSKDQPEVDSPHLNAWFGPAKTITPLHTDGYHNLLCQVVGTKYVRLYPPQATEKLRPRGMEDGVDMSNTSELDVGILEGWDESPPPPAEEGETTWTGEEAEGTRRKGGHRGEWTDEMIQEVRSELEGVEYWECILGPGDVLLIPIGWWHYVRSLSISFSVSFWWN